MNQISGRPGRAKQHKVAHSARFRWTSLGAEVLGLGPSGSAPKRGLSEVLHFEERASLHRRSLQLSPCKLEQLVAFRQDRSCGRSSGCDHRTCLQNKHQIQQASSHCSQRQARAIASWCLMAACRMVRFSAFGSQVAAPNDSTHESRKHTCRVRDTAQTCEASALRTAGARASKVPCRPQLPGGPQASPQPGGSAAPEGWCPLGRSS